MSLSNGSGPATAHEVRFVDYPTIEYAEGVMTKVTAKLLGVEQIVTGIAYTETVIGLIGSLGGIRGFDTASNNLNKFDTALHVTYPSSGYGPAA